MVESYQKTIDPNSIDKETTKAFKKVKFDIEELRRLVNTKQDKQTNVLVEMNNMKSELKIEFREELLELQKTMTQEIDALRKEVLYYRELCEQHRMEHHKVKIIEKKVEVVKEEPQEEFQYERVVENKEEPVVQEKAKSYYQSTENVEQFEYNQENSSKKTYLKWITVGDNDLDSIDEVIVR